MLTRFKDVQLKALNSFVHGGIHSLRRHGDGTPLTAVLVILTGILGAVVGTTVLDLLRVRDEAARGFALGVASHGIGTARAFQVSEETGAFAGLAMGLNGALTAVLVPILARLFGL